MLPHEFRNLLEKFSRGTCTPEEEQLIIDWYNNIETPASRNYENEDLGEVEEKIWGSVNPEPSRKRGWVPLIIRAAVITVPLVAGAILYFNRQSHDESSILSRESLMSQNEAAFINKGKSVLHIPLSDGSVVTLQPSSEIVLASDYGKSSRELRLNGEAFFQVKPDPERPFVVYSNELTTRVLGTSFNVRAYEDAGEITVAVKSGRVSVYTNQERKHGANSTNYQEVILTPNQQVVYHRDRELVSKQLVEKPEVILPNSSLFRMQFENEAVSTLFRVLEENYGVEIRYDKELLSNCRLTTSMSDEGLYERIEVICKAIGASYTIGDDAAITITSNGCLN